MTESITPIETADRRPQRIVLAKVGLDGHDRGIKVVARGLRDAGYHVIYAGIWQSPESVARAAADEDADWLGLSILSGAHMTLVPRVLDALGAASTDRVRVIVGGIVPDADVARLQQLGVAHVFGPGTAIGEIVDVLRAATERARQANGPVLDRVALARSITQAARGERVDVPGANPQAQRGQSLVVAVTGSAGVGKSTLIGKLIECIRAANKTVAVLACDPESPLTGGALLGDRIRMAIDAGDEGLFMRSLAVPSGCGSIAKELDSILGVTGAYGFDVVIVETAGAGQGDTAIRKLADVVVVLLQPESGDETQWQKAGLLEIADIVAIHKADLPGAKRAEAEVREHLNLPGCRAIPVLGVSTSKGQGVEDLWKQIDSRVREHKHPSIHEVSPGSRTRRHAGGV